MIAAALYTITLALTPKPPLPRTRQPLLVLSNNPRENEYLSPNPRVPLRIVTTARGLQRKGMLSRLRDAWSSYLTSSSDQLWQSVFDECDCDGDGGINRRELLVLLYRLGVEIPSDDELKEQFSKYDVNENGTLDFHEFTSLVRDLDSAAFTPSGVLNSENLRVATKKWRGERKQIVLWRNLFNRLDALPRDGYIETDELSTALRRAGVAVTDEQVRFQISKYDTDNDNRCAHTSHLLTHAPTTHTLSPLFSRKQGVIPGVFSLCDRFNLLLRTVHARVGSGRVAAIRLSIRRSARTRVCRKRSGFTGGRGRSDAARYSR